MANLTVTLRVEPELLQDAFEDVIRIFEALARRHGPDYRALERRIEDIIEERVQISIPQPHDLGGAHYILLPPPEIAAIIRDARVLGVI